MLLKEKLKLGNDKLGMNQLLMGKLKLKPKFAKNIIILNIPVTYIKKLFIKKLTIFNKSLLFLIYFFCIKLCRKFVNKYKSFEHNYYKNSFFYKL